MSDLPGQSGHALPSTVRRFVPGGDTLPFVFGWRSHSWPSGLNIVSIGVEDKGGVVLHLSGSSWAGRAVILPPAARRCLVKAVHRARFSARKAMWTRARKSYARPSKRLAVPFRPR